MSGQLAGRVAIVTGAGGAIGGATSLLLARSGAAVCACDIDERRAAHTAGAIEAQGLGRGLAAACDVAQPTAVDALFDRVEESLGPVSLLVNGAAVAAAARPVDLDDAQWQRLIDVNLGGTWSCCRAFVARARCSGRGGAIVNVAHAGCPTAGGVVGMTRALALDHARDGIRVNCLCAGDVAALGRHDAPELVARSIAYLASDAASFSVGSALVAGGSASIGLSVP